MNSINTSVLSTQLPASDTSNSGQATMTPITGTSTVNTVLKPEVTISGKSKQLQPDNLALSEEARAKSAEAETSTNEKNEANKSIDASYSNGAMSPEEAASEEKAKESELDKKIRELSMEILELSVKIQMLQDKEDKTSAKERQSLEVDLAMKKGELEATLERKLKQVSA